MPSPVALGPRILRLWARLAPWPGGRWVFSRLVAWMVPYSGALGARIVLLAPGACEAVLTERRAVRNHLRSVHAIALANLAELASGLAMLTATGDEVRGIVTALRIEFLKKGRGTLRATCRATPPAAVAAPVDLDVVATITDGGGEVVAVTTVTWRLAPPT